MDIQRGGGPQASLWNGRAGQAWVETQDLLDRLFRPIEQRLAKAALADGAKHLLDVGCGTGSTTVAAARLLGAQGRCVGIDISEPMIGAARARAQREGLSATFIRADAQTYAFEPASFDRVISRFGVMFFDDPVAAFANLRRATRAGGALQFFAWRGPDENPFMTTAERAAAPLLPNMPVRQPDAPGQFAFADRHRIHRLLEESGWAAIDIQPIDIDCTLPEAELADYFTRLGPVGLALEGADVATRAEVIETVRAAFDPFVRGNEVRFTAACWAVNALRM